MSHDTDFYSEQTMKKKMGLISVFIVVTSILLMGEAPAHRTKQVNIAMILWRGETQAEKGFQSRLMASPKYKVKFTIFDAAQDKTKLNHIIENLETSRYHLIYSFGTTVTQQLKNRITDLPIVFNIVSRPVKANIIDSWDNSGCNIVGASNTVPMASAFHTLNKILHIGRLGVIYNPREVNSIIQRDEVKKLEKEFGYTMVDLPIESPESIPRVIQKAVTSNVDAVLLPSDSLVKASADQIIPPLNELKIPTIVLIPGMVEDDSAFVGLGPDYFQLGNLAADKALAILDGKKPSELSSSPLDRLHMTVNLSTAEKIGVTIPIQLLRISTIVR
jgi:putative ABC transport system substrate-binding protein